MGPFWRRSPLLVAVTLVAIGVGALLDVFDGDDGPAKPAPDTKGPPVAAEARPATVERVDAGDLLELSGRGRVKLLGVSVPVVDERRLCFAAEARGFTRKAALGRRVRYQDSGERDITGEPLVYVWTPDGRSLNARLLSGGYAAAQLGEPHRYARRFGQLAANARAREVGRWARCKD